jgi:hypothetical protein
MVSPPTDTGVASAMVNTMQQIGGSIGTALLSSIFASAVSSFLEGRPPARRSPPTPRCTATPSCFGVAAGVFAFGAVVLALVMHSINIEADAPAEPAGEPQLARS